MPTRVRFTVLTAASCVALASCSSTANKAPATAAVPAADVHDMAGMSDHEMAGMSSHSSAELAFLFPSGDDKGWSKVENGMQHTMPPDVPMTDLPPATRAELVRQLSLTMDVIKKYPTVKDAEAGGYRRAGPFLPGLGTHYVKGGMVHAGPITDDEILHPGTIVYGGNAPDSPIVGFMYMAVGMGASAKEPDGFAGPNDHWHYHTGICLTRGAGGAMEALGFDGSITAAECKTQGGNFVAATQYLLHVWTVPAYTNPLGVFAHANPRVTCSDGTYYTDTHELTNACRHP